MCNPKDNGGLGIMDIDIKNRALLNKWVWRYGEEPNAMWKVIIASKYGGDFFIFFRFSSIRGGSLAYGKILQKSWAVRIFKLTTHRLVLDSLLGIKVVYVFGRMIGLGV